MKITVQVLIEPEANAPAVVEEVGHFQREGLTPLRGAIPVRRSDFHGFCRINDQPSGQQADGEKAADALDTAGAHLLLQVRVQVLNDEWRNTFCRWYLGMLPVEPRMGNAA